MLRLIDVDRLLETDEINFACFESTDPVPEYAVACFVRGRTDARGEWVHEDDDFTYDKCLDFVPQYMTADSHEAYYKLFGASERAKSEGCKFIWIDFSCIDKSCAADVESSLNSRFQWYAAAKVCLVYLPDCQEHRKSHRRLYVNGDGIPCRWFFQSWTRPTLIASQKLKFYDREWKLINEFEKRIQGCAHSSTDFEREIQHMTSIAPTTLVGMVPPYQFSVSTRLSWADGPFGNEEEEDLAYSLVGLFGVYLEPNYGEGGANAFRRVAQKIIDATRDLSILAWDAEGYYAGNGDCGALPSSGAWYQWYLNVMPMPTEYPFSMTGNWILMTGPLYPVRLPHGERYYLCLEYNGEGGESKGIYLRKLSQDNTFRREGDRMVDLKITKRWTYNWSEFYIECWI
ncbi:hypothetical protein F4859DRAFT_516169 [Xylaria cf. heliscus]|nr:hypothetical protein F4859DRAFT_516169 [Xylaria cf. heliscus]